MNDLGHVVRIIDWTISTNVLGEITVAQGNIEGWFILNINSIDVVKIFVSAGNTMKVNAIPGYAVQFIHDKKFISVIEEA